METPKGSVLGLSLLKIFISYYGTRGRRVLMKYTRDTKLGGTVNIEAVWDIIKNCLTWRTGK